MKFTSNLHFKCEIVYLYALALKIANMSELLSKLLYKSYPQVIHKVIHIYNYVDFLTQIVIKVTFYKKVIKLLVF